MADRTRKPGGVAATQQHGAERPMTVKVPQPGTHVEPRSQQAKLLNEMTKNVDAMPEIYEDAQRKREVYMQRLTDMIEETLRQIIKARHGMEQKARHVRDTMTSYGAKFDHDLACTREDLRRELADKTGKMEEVLAGLENRVIELEGDLEEQHAFRVRHVEETLGPIRDEVYRIHNALEAEKKSRRKQEKEREKVLADEVELFTKQLDADKFDRSQQLGALHDWVNQQQQFVAKRQYQVEKEVGDVSKAHRTDFEQATKERIAVQHRVIESIASFVKRYHEQLQKEMDAGIGVPPPEETKSESAVDNDVTVPVPATQE
eukprot:TRINITY_DN123004_c0_g1_i1.p1 TRINITY_DN123004_c0_g1~~TRINITY_DN123004_c0_g1_i1.p1  ORF type:complete len:318 (+),score=127.85 TRINITY_DN123004_c0_g1_i1:93-1046(+)